VKAPPFRYARAGSLEEALSLLEAEGEEAKLLAGGQSLVPALAFRLLRPSALVDIDRLAELDYVEQGGGGLRIGALRRHASLEADPGLDGAWGALREAAALVGHHPIRVRGTLGGSIAHADPAAELAVAALALDAELVLRSARGERRVAAADFFLAPYLTALEPGEALVEVALPPPPPEPSAAFEELSERAGDYALASACVVLGREEGRVVHARVALGSVGPVPLRARSAERVLLEQPAGGEAIEEAAREAARECEPGSDTHAGAGYRRRLVAALVRRALRRALPEAAA
jgi:CO/xanthine dehydrogenase FAD-binding subunit